MLAYLNGHKTINGFGSKATLQKSGNKNKDNNFFKQEANYLPIQLQTEVPVRSPVTTHCEHYFSNLS